MASSATTFILALRRGSDAIWKGRKYLSASLSSLQSNERGDRRGVE
jgi:hypothetical protein